MLAKMTRAATFRAAPQPVKKVVPSGERKHCTEWAKISAVEAFNEQAQAEQQRGVEDIRPRTFKVQADCGFERFYFGRF